MNRFFFVVGVAGMVLLPVGFLIGLCRDLAHPELWSDCQHDPRVYGTLAAVVVPLLVWMVVREMLKCVRAARELNEAKRILKEMEGKLR
jgi:hypothetical protein